MSATQTLKNEKSNVLTESAIERDAIPEQSSLINKEVSIMIERQRGKERTQSYQSD
jgi:hypothetical protein